MLVRSLTSKEYCTYRYSVMQQVHGIGMHFMPYNKIIQVVYVVDYYYDVIINNYVSFLDK